MKKIKNKLIYILPALIVLIIMSIIFLIKGMYPFGTKTTLQIDADYNYVPALFKIHDIFYLKDSMLWDFKIGGGANIYGSLVLHSIYSPLNWLVIIIKRDNIINFFNILTIIKFMLMATTMLIFIRKNFKKVDSFWQVLLSITYVFSGWTLLMYSNIFYIDTVILFPIVMHYYIKLFKDNKNLGFIITLSYSLILNLYLTYMIYLFIIFSSLLAILFLVEKEKRKEKIINISFGLVLPLFIAAFAYLPTLVQVLESNRIVTPSYKSYFHYFFLKTINLTMCSIIVFLFIKFIKQTEKKEKLFYIILLLSTTIGIIVEPINRAWHTGSFYSFPYRYSFITIFILIYGSLKCLLKTQEKNNKIDDKKIFIMTLLCIILILIFNIKFNAIIQHEMIGLNITRPSIFIALIIIFIMLLTLYKYIFELEKGKDKKIMISLLVFLEIFINCNWCFNNYNYKQTKTTLDYEKEYKIEDNQLYKYKDNEEMLGLNSSYITRNATLSNWLHIVPNKQMEYIKKMGYSTISTNINSDGGTIVSDAINGTRYIYSQQNLSKTILKPVKQLKNKLNIYELKNDISFGLLYNEKIEIPDTVSSLEIQNYYYKKLFNTDEDIIKIENITLDYNDEYTYKIKNKEEIMLYIEVTENIKDSVVMINQNSYSLKKESRIQYLETLNEDINIKLIMDEKEDKNPKKISVGYIKPKDFIEMTKKMNTQYNKFEFNKNKLYINIDSEKEQYLFLPINNINGWTGTINGKKIKIEDEMYTFMSIKLEEGNNDIKLEFIPAYLKEGIRISLLGIALLIIYTIFKEKINNIKILKNIITILYYIISFAFVIFVYIISNFIFI